MKLTNTYHKDMLMHTHALRQTHSRTITSLFNDPCQKIRFAITQSTVTTVERPLHNQQHGDVPS